MSDPSNSLRISVVTPSYNQGAFIEETLKSVLIQRSEIFEYHIVDGGSTDNTAEILAKYSRVVDSVTSEPDRGQCDAINKGFARCSGDVLYFLNSDDLLLPGAIAQVKACFGRSPQAQVVTGYAAAIDENSALLYARRAPHDRVSWARWGYMRPHQPSTFFRRALFEQAGGMDIGLHCVLDSDLWYRFFDLGAEWTHTNSFLSAFRLHQAAKGATQHARYREERKVMHTRYPKYTHRPVRYQIGRLMVSACRLYEITRPKVDHQALRHQLQTIHTSQIPGM